MTTKEKQMRKRATSEDAWRLLNRYTELDEDLYEVEGAVFGGPDSEFELKLLVTGAWGTFDVVITDLNIEEVKAAINAYASTYGKTVDVLEYTTQEVKELFNLLIHGSIEVDLVERR